MDKLGDLPIDWANVNWPYVIALVLLVFVCTLIGTSLSFRRTFLGAVLTALLFAAAFVYRCRRWARHRKQHPHRLRHPRPPPRLPLRSLTIR
jgi:uncharacterized membrane protein YfcA